MAEPLPSKQKTRVRFSLPAPTSPRSSSGRGHRSFKSDDAGSNPARGTNALPLRLAGRAPGFELGRLGSNPRGAATFQHRGIAQSVERRFHTPRQPQVRSLLPRPAFAGLAKWEGNGSWPRHEAVRSRQPVRACSSSVERRIPNPRQRGFNSFLARHNQSGRSPVLAACPTRRLPIGQFEEQCSVAIVGLTALRQLTPARKVLAAQTRLTHRPAAVSQWRALCLMPSSSSDFSTIHCRYSGSLAAMSP